MFETFDIVIGASNGIPSMEITINNNTIEVFSILQDDTVYGIFSWMKNIIGFGFIGGAILKVVGNFSDIINGRAKFIGGGSE